MSKSPKAPRPPKKRSAATVLRGGSPPADSSPAVGDSVGDQLGATIRAHRKAMGRTMQDVATEAGLSQPFFSQIERGHALPSMRSLDRIALALGTSGISLLSGSTSASSSDVIRPVDRASLVLNEEDTGSSATALTPANRQLRGIEFTGGWSEFQQYSVHHNDEMVVILEGDFVADVDGDLIELAPGDAISYAGGVPHRYRTEGDGPHRFLAVIVPDDYEVVERGGPRTASSELNLDAMDSCGDQPERTGA